jgi:hypothetical protein
MLDNSHMDAQTARQISPQPGWNLLPIVLSTVAWIAMIGGLLFFLDAASRNSLTEVGESVAGVFIALLFLAIASCLRWLQLIQWRLGLRAGPSV